MPVCGQGCVKTPPNDTGRPAYHPTTTLKLFVYGYLNRLYSSRRLERESQCNVEQMWLTGRLATDFKTIADFRKDNGVPIRLVCRQFVILEFPGFRGHLNSDVQIARGEKCPGRKNSTSPSLKIPSRTNPGFFAGIRRGGSE